MKASIISVGTELVAGQTLDTNAAWLARQLTRLGMKVAEHLTVGDEVASLETAIRRALEGPNVVVVTGGLGPTKDDLTREAVAAALGEPLELDEAALSQIEAFFARWRRPMHEANRAQAMIPRGCRVLPNRLGTAPGFRWTSGDGLLLALPGVPREMKAMFGECVEPELSGRGTGCVLHAAVRCFGMPEAELGQRIADLMSRGRNPDVGTTASGAILTVRITARGDDEPQTQAMLSSDVEEVRRRLGAAVFGSGDDELQDAVARLLSERGETVSTAESCTGGLLSKRLTDIAGSSAYFLRGYVTYSDASKTDVLGVPPETIVSSGAVSEQVAAAMASGCRQAAGTDWALSITGIAGPGGGSSEKPVGLVFVGLARAEEVHARRYLFGEHLARAEIRDRSCKAAFSWLRLRLMGTE